MSKKIVITSMLVLLLAFLGIGILNVAMGRPSLITAKLNSGGKSTADTSNSGNANNDNTGSSTVQDKNNDLSGNKFDNVKLERLLKVGMTGDDVKKIQYILKSKDYYNGEIDGNFTENLKASLEKFQMDCNIKPTGEMGPFTASALSDDKIYEAYSNIVLTRDIYPGVNGDDVKKVQFLLKWTGYYNGQITGNFDTATSNAVKEFQRDNNISQTGDVGKLTRAKLEEVE